MLLQLILLEASCSTEAAAGKELNRVAGVSMAGEAGRGHHSLSCTGEEVDHAVLCCKVQLKRFQARQELRGFASQAFELAWICLNHLQIQIGIFKMRTRMRVSDIIQLEPSETKQVFLNGFTSAQICLLCSHVRFNSVQYFDAFYNRF